MNLQIISYVLLIFFGSLLLGEFTVWFSYLLLISILAFLFKMSKRNKLFWAFFSVFILWFLLMQWKKGMDGGVLAGQISILFNDIPILFLSIIISLIAGFFGGISALLGHELQMFKK